MEILDIVVVAPPSTHKYATSKNVKDALRKHHIRA